MRKIPKISISMPKNNTKQIKSQSTNGKLKILSKHKSNPTIKPPLNKFQFCFKKKCSQQNKDNRQLQNPQPIKPEALYTHNYQIDYGRLSPIPSQQIFYKASNKITNEQTKSSNFSSSNKKINKSGKQLQNIENMYKNSFGDHTNLDRKFQMIKLANTQRFQRNNYETKNSFLYSDYKQNSNKKSKPKKSFVIKLSDIKEQQLQARKSRKLSYFQ